MIEFLAVLGVVAPVFAVAGAGLVVRKLEWLTEEADRSLLRLTINLLFPCLILDTALGNAALHQLGNLTLAPLVGFGTVAVGVILAWAVRRLAGAADARTRRTFALTVGLYNYGYVPLPLALSMFGDETAGVLFVHNVGVEVALWTIGLMVLTGIGRGGWRHIINAPLIAILLALLLNFSGLDARIPTVVRSTMHLLAQCAIPLALLLIGATVADHSDGFHTAHGWRIIGVASLLRLGLLPLAFLLLARYLPASTELKRVIVLEAAMPSAVFPIVMAKHYGGDPPTAVRIVIGTTLTGLLTIPLWIRFGIQFVGL
jgi:hypothetical protein